MVILGIFLYIVFIFIGLLVNKRKKVYCKKNKFVKKGIKLKGLVINNIKLFTSLKSQEFLLYKKLCSAVFIFDKKERLLECCKVFDKVGIDYLKPIYKYEVYGKNIDLQKVFATLSLIKNLDKKGISFNFFVFFNDSKNFKALNKLIRYFNYKRVVVRLYNCCEINYKLLGCINYLNTNSNCLSQNFIRSEVNNQGQNFHKFNKNRFELNKKDIVLSSRKEGLFLIKDEQLFSFDRYTYDSYYLNSVVENKDFTITVSKTFDMKNDCDIFKLTIKNCASTIQQFNCYFGTIFFNKTFKNSIYSVMQKKEKTSICCLGSEEKNLNLFGFSEFNFDKDYLLASKKIKLKPLEQSVFYFAALKTNRYLCNDYFEKIKLSFQDCWQQYTKIKLVRVLSNNKTLNYLINDFLPKKIIEKSIISGKVESDLKFLIEEKFDLTLIDKSFLNKSLNSFFLANNDLFKIYFNLLYFYFGVWHSGEILFLNDDKSFILTNTVVSCFELDKTFKIEVINNNTKNEIMVNKIKFSNLKSFSLNSVNKDNNIKLVF